MSLASAVSPSANVLTDLNHSRAQSFSECVCSHCGFSVPAGKKKIAGDQDKIFCCYGCVFAYQLIQSGSGKQISWALVKLGLAAFLAMNVMGFALALHSSSIYPDFYQTLGEGGRAYDELLRYLLLFMSAPVFFLIGVPLYENVINDARRGVWSVDGFIGLSVLASMIYSIVNTMRGVGAVYYDISVMVLVFLTLGRFLEAKFRYSASQALEELLAAKPQVVRQLINGLEVDVSASDLNPGDVICVRPGSEIPIDGEIIEGSAVLNVSAIDGEFLPVLRSVSEKISAGTILSDGFIKLKVLHKMKDSWVARLRGIILEARGSKASIERVSEKIVTGMTYATLLLATLAFVLGFQSHGLMEGVMRALAVLVIVCPCALGAAIPLALWRSYQEIVSRGVLFKDLSRMETLAKIKGVFFDKTGTLTTLEPAISKIQLMTGVCKAELISNAAAVAFGSNHPYSKAIVACALTRATVTVPSADGILSKVGKGISGRVNGKDVFVGCLDYLTENKIFHKSGTIDSNGQPSVFVGWDGEVQGGFQFSEILRPDTSEMLHQLADSKLPVFVLTGDRQPSADIASQLKGVQIVAGLSAQQKLDYLKEWEKKNGPALMVGEGLNDAPVLAAASVSLAVDAALDKAKNEADFQLPDNQMTRVPWLIRASKKALAKVRSNLIWAFIYNAIALPFAVAGKINPVFAALLMIFSSVFIILGSMRKTVI